MPKTEKTIKNNDKTSGLEIITPIFQWEKSGPAVITVALTFFLLSILAMAGVSPVSKMQQSFFCAVKMPFENISISGHILHFPPYFVLNLIFAIFFAGVMLIYIRAKTAGHANSASFNRTVIIFLLILGVHLSCLALFAAKKFYVLQLLIFIGEMFFLASYAAGKDAESGKALMPGLLQAREITMLAAFSVIVFFLNIFDWKSWKYSFIGDEWSFYEYALSLLSGIRPLDFFSGNGVYDFNPVMSSVWQALIMFFTGKGLFGWKVSSAVIVPLSIIPFYMWQKALFGRTAAIVATAAFALSAAMMAFSRIGYNNIQAVFFFGSAMICAELALRKNSMFWTFMTALVMGLGWYTYYLSRLMIFPVFFYWLFHPMGRMFSARNKLFFAAVFGITISFLPFGDGFLENMLNRSAIGASEISDPAERPWYLITNFIHSLFYFITKARDSHYITGGFTDPLTAAAAFMGLVWALFSIKKDWRAGFLLASYVVLVLFTGGLVQYHYPANTRMQFMVPLISTAAGLGLSRVLMLASYFKRGYILRKAGLAASVVFIAGLNINAFFVHTPRHFQYTTQAHVIKYLQKNPKKEVYLALSGLTMINETVKIYGLERNSHFIDTAALKSMAENGLFKGKVLILDYATVKGQYPQLTGFVKNGYVVRDYVTGGPILYVYDFSGDMAYHQAFSELLLAGRTSYIIAGSDLDKEAPGTDMTSEKNVNTSLRRGSGDNAVKVSHKTEIKSRFNFERAYRAMRGAPLGEREYSVVKLLLPAGIKSASDLGFDGRERNLFVADSGAGKIYRLRDDGNGKLEALGSFDVKMKKRFVFFGGPSGDNCLYIAYDEAHKALFVLDSCAGRITEFGTDGTYRRTITTGKFLKGCNYISVSRDGGHFATSNTDSNVVFLIDRNGTISSSYATTRGNGEGQLNRPCGTAIDTAGGVYVCDSINGRVNYFSADFAYIKNYRIGPVSRTQWPDIDISGNTANKPFFAVSQPEMKRIFFFMLNEDVFRYVDFSAAGLNDSFNPSALAGSENNVYYVLDTVSGYIIKINIKEGAVNGNFMPGHR